MKKILSSVAAILASSLALAAYNPPNPTTVNGVAKYSDTRGTPANTNVKKHIPLQIHQV